MRVIKGIVTMQHKFNIIAHPFWMLTANCLKITTPLPLTPLFLQGNGV